MSKVITKTCKYCSKLAKSTSFFTLDNIEYVSLSCGHTLINDKSTVEKADYSDFVSEDGRSLYPFQIDGCKFVENANFSCLIADEMGLGKTVQALAILKKHPSLLPCLVLTKTSLKYQWFCEIVRWTGLVPQIIDGNDKPSDLFKIYIMSVDVLRNLDWLDNWSVKTVILDECQSIKNIQSKRTFHIRQFIQKGWIEKRIEKESVDNKERIKMIAQDLMSYHGVSDSYTLAFANLGPYKLGLCESKTTGNGTIKGKIILSEKHVRESKEDEIIETILHEIAHAITPGAGHKDIWSKICLEIGGNGKAIASCDGTIEPNELTVEKVNVIALSGTPIKNKINEYFPILNILRPEIFYSKESFERNWVGYYTERGKSKAGRLVDPIRFKEKTKDFIIRRERLEVLPDLPLINRVFHYTELSAETEKYYKKLVKQFVEFSDEHNGQTGGRNAGETLAYLTKMRHCVGLAKIKPTVEFVKDFLFDTDRKLTLFVHHQDVGLSLKNLLKPICEQNDLLPPLNLTSDLNVESRQNTITNFKNEPRHRIMIASTLASGEGLNLQFCSDCIMVERQWNPANEEQAEGRFSRIGSTAESISATYMTAIGTIDEWFMKLVENKRRINREAMTGQKVDWNESETLSELSKMIINHGRKAWNF